MDAQVAADMVTAAKANRQTTRRRRSSSEGRRRHRGSRGQTQNSSKPSGASHRPSDAHSSRPNGARSKLRRSWNTPKRRRTVAQAQAATKAKRWRALHDAAALDRSVGVGRRCPGCVARGCGWHQGLSIDGDGCCLTAWRSIKLSGQGRLFFAVEVARRLNAKKQAALRRRARSPDAEHRRMFIERATKDGFQLIATRVADDGGDPVAKPIR